MSLFIGIDSGTQSVKAIVLDLDTRQVVAEARAPHTLIPGLPVGNMEQHPQEWVDALDKVIAEVAAKVDRERVRGIGVSGQQHGFVPLDANGAVIRPAKLWCDTSTIAECAQITAKLGGEKAALKKTGNLVLPGFTAAKILWLKKYEPANYRKLRHVLLPHDYLNFHLTGAYTMEFGDASGTSLLDVRKRTWSRAAINAIDSNLADWLPPLHDSHQPAGTLLPDVAERYGLSTDVIVAAGGGDNMMGAIGTGNVKKGVVTASFGTSGTIYAFSKEPIVDPQGEIAAFCSSTGGWLPLMCTMNVTTVTELVCRQFGFDHRSLDAAIETVSVGANGLMLLPYFAGERTPDVPAGSGVWFGVNQTTSTPAHYARAAMEGVTMGMNYGLRRMMELGVKPKEIRVTGGGAKSPVWRQIMADVFGVPVVGMVEDEGAAVGAAIQAAWCVARQVKPKADIGELTDGIVAVKEETRCEPRKEHAGRYRELQSVQNSLSEALRETFVAHRTLSLRPE